MDTAKRTLESLSVDPEVRARARDREGALRAYHHTIASERAEGEARREGAPRRFVRRLCCWRPSGLERPSVGR